MAAVFDKNERMMQPAKLKNQGVDQKMGLRVL